MQQLARSLVKEVTSMPNQQRVEEAKKRKEDLDKKLDVPANAWTY